MIDQRVKKAHLPHHFFGSDRVQVTPISATSSTVV
jgi:hypothetical protein